MARERGCPKDDLDYRARWAGVTQMQDSYVDVQLTWPDVNCASCVVSKGVCLYKVKANAGLSDAWLCEHVTPQITAVFGNKVGAILAKPLLWACYSDIFSDRVQPSLRNRICGQFIRLEREGYGNGVNPIQKVEVIPNEGKYKLLGFEREPLLLILIHLCFLYFTSRRTG